MSQIFIPHFSTKSLQEITVSTKVTASVEEYFSYLYLPIKLPGMESCLLENIEKRLHPFVAIIRECTADFIGGLKGWKEFKYSYVYLTAKSAMQRGGTKFN